jgi:hypothetical protein
VQTLPSLTCGTGQRRLLTQSNSGPQLSGMVAHSGHISTFSCAGGASGGILRPPEGKKEGERLLVRTERVGSFYTTGRVTVGIPFEVAGD